MSTRLERFIPFQKADVLEMCLKEQYLEKEDHESFRKVCKMIEGLLHFEYNERLERMKRAYDPFNPDSDTRTIKKYSDEEKLKLQKAFAKDLGDLLNSANFEKIMDNDLMKAMKDESLFKIRLQVDFNDFEEVVFFCRGENKKKETLVKWFGLKKEEIEFTNYERVAIYIKFKGEKYFTEKKRKNLLFDPDATIIKLFQNVPKSDLEMLFPNSKVRMKMIDKLLIGVPAVAFGVAMIITKLGASIMLIASVIAFWLGLRKNDVMINQDHLIALAIGLGTVGGYIFRQVNEFKNRKLRFMKKLSDSLYFKNLDNNSGVFFNINDAAEEEDFKEAVLAYYFLLVAKKEITEKELDENIEKWFAEKWNCQLDFESDDALAKLDRFQLITRNGEQISCKSLPEAKQQLTTLWNNHFDEASC